MSSIESRILGEHPRLLPVGFFTRNGRLRKMRLNQYLSEHDHLILRVKARLGSNLLEIAQEIFPVLVRSIDGHSWNEIADELDCTVDDLIASMPVADVLTVIASVRHTEISDELYFRSDCPICGANNDDDPKKGLSHSLGGMDVYHWGPDCEPLVEVQLKDTLIKLYPLQLIDFADFCAETIPLDLRYLIYSTVSISGWFDRSSDDRMTLEIYEQVLTNPWDRELWYSAVQSLSEIGPTLELGNECFQCHHEWTSSLPVEDRLDFFLGLLTPPQENELVDMAFYLTFGEQAPFKSIDEVNRLPVRVRDAFIRKLTETYKSQQEEMKKNTRKGGGSKTSTEYV